MKSESINNRKKELAFSLIVGTKGRLCELERLLFSLERQVLDSFEILIIDQNENGLIEGLVSVFAKTLDIRVVKCEPGLSKSRNLGLKFCRGRWVAFPDDDCVYPRNLLQNIHDLIGIKSNCDGLSVLVTDTEGRFSAGGYMSASEHTITKDNVWRSAVSPSLFLKLEAVKEVGGFDEALGVGADTVWGSGEETDLVLKLLEAGYVIDYSPSLKVIHPRFQSSDINELIKRGFRYGCGFGAVLKKHRWSLVYSIYYCFLQFARCVQKFLLLRFREAFFHLSMGLGRIYGWVTYSK